MWALQQIEGLAVWYIQAQTNLTFGVSAGKAITVQRGFMCLVGIKQDSKHSTTSREWLPQHSAITILQASFTCILQAASSTVQKGPGGLVRGTAT